MRRRIIINIDDDGLDRVDAVRRVLTVLGEGNRSRTGQFSHPCACTVWADDVYAYCTQRAASTVSFYVGTNLPESS